MTDDELLDALRHALHTEGNAWVPAPHAIDRIRERTDHLSVWSRYDYAVIPIALLLILLFALGGS